MGLALLRESDFGAFIPIAVHILPPTTSVISAYSIELVKTRYALV